MSLNLEESVEGQWQAFKDGIMTSTDASVGCARKKQPDWLVDAADILMPLMDGKAKVTKSIYNNRVLLLSMNLEYFRGW